MLLLTILLANFLGNASPARLAYTLTFGSADTTMIAVTLVVRHAPAAMQLAANAHPEYDDKYWRYVDGVTATTSNGRTIAVSKLDSVRWQIQNEGGADVNIAYRVKFPEEPAPRSAWRPFLSPTGGLVGGPHSFLYIVGLEKESPDVTLDIPRGWKVGSGLEGPSTARHFTAKDVHALMESPMLVGNLSEWTFKVRNIPHRVFYWKLPNASAFDSTAFVSGIEKVATEAMQLFKTAPYREYSFLFQDGAWDGGLEHPNSVTLGAQSGELARNPNFTLREIAHEFFHTWNLMAIEPAEYREVDYRVQPPVAELWFSEGLTIFYADLLRRRAGIPLDDSTRLVHLENLMEQYTSMPGNARYSAEQISRVAYNARPTELGDYTASAHLLGEVLGAVLDFRIRDATNGARSMDDVMRSMYTRFADRKFTSRDVMKAVDDVCSCSSASIFNQYVFNAGAIDFNRYLEPMGLRSEISMKPATGRDGKLQSDLRVWAWEEGDSLLLRVGNANSVWGKAGLHTGDRIVSVNGSAVSKWPAFRNVLRNLAIGDSISVAVQRGDQKLSKVIVVTGYDQPDVTLRQIARPSEKQQRLYRTWLAGN
jgi:predicted metalloprotease with PDZ domain